MLGYLAGIALVSIALIPFVFTDVSADSIVVDFDKAEYFLGDSLTIPGGILDFGMPAGFYFGNVNSDLEFSTSFLAKSGVNFRVDGICSIKSHYAETEAVPFF